MTQDKHLNRVLLFAELHRIKREEQETHHDQENFCSGRWKGQLRGVDAVKKG